MKPISFTPARFRAVVIVFFLLSTMAWADQLSELGAEPDPAKRSQRALILAEASFEEARHAYTASEIKKGDAHLDEMTKALNSCLDALNATRKSRLFKPAEMRVLALSRRLHTLVGDLSVDDRGWAEFTERQVEAIHEKLLSGVMKK